MSLPELASLYREAVLDFTWRQWSQMGVSGSFTHADPWCQDPEALLVFTLEVARHEPRMFDEVLDWLASHGEELMRQRLKNILALDPEAPANVVEAAMECAGMPLSRVDRVEGPKAMLFLGEFAGMATSPEHDETFLRHGLLRPPFRRSKKTRPIPLDRPINLTYRLRALFGPSSRSEAVRRLLSLPSREWGTSEIADSVTLSRISIYKALQALDQAGVGVRMHKGRKDIHWTLDHAHWLPWIKLDASDLPPWIDWPSTLRGLIALWRWFHAPERESESSYIRSSRAREEMEKASKLIEGHGLPWSVASPAAYSGERYWGAFESDVQRLANILA